MKFCDQETVAACLSIVDRHPPRLSALGLSAREVECLVASGKMSRPHKSGVGPQLLGGWRLSTAQREMVDAVIRANPRAKRAYLAALAGVSEQVIRSRIDEMGRAVA